MLTNEQMANEIINQIGINRFKQLTQQSNKLFLPLACNTQIANHVKNTCLPVEVT